MIGRPQAATRSATDVDVWHVDLDIDPGVIGDVLSAEEHARAARFATSTLRQRFTAGRAALRLILAGHLGADPAALRFVSGPWGKPALANEVSNLRFNLSHSDGRMLCALVAGREVGIDIERMRDDVDLDALARRFFAPREAAALEALPPALRRDGFYAGWTRKEAFIKATGRGLSTPLDSFAVTLGPGEGAALIEVDGRSDAAARWAMAAFAPAPGFAAALVVEGGFAVPRHRRWPDGEPMPCVV